MITLNIFKLIDRRKMFKKLLKSFAIVLFLSSSFVGKAISSELTFFTIGTGGTAYTYYPVGGMIATNSKLRDLENVGRWSCGVDGLIASAVSSEDLLIMLMQFYLD